MHRLRPLFNVKKIQKRKKVDYDKRISIKISVYTSTRINRSCVHSITAIIYAADFSWEEILIKTYTRVNN